MGVNLRKHRFAPGLPPGWCGTSARTAPCTSRRVCCPTHCARYCAPCQPLFRAVSGCIRSPPPTCGGRGGSGSGGGGGVCVCVCVRGQSPVAPVTCQKNMLAFALQAPIPHPKIGALTPHRWRPGQESKQGATFSIEEQLPRRNVRRFRGRLVLMAQRLLYYSTLGSRVMKKKRTPGFATKRFREEATCQSST